MPTYTTPGVYFEWRKENPSPLSALRTDIAGFVGVAYRGPIHRAVRIDGPNRFFEFFGPPIDQGYLAGAVEGFFANGGEACWVVRVACAGPGRQAEWSVKAEGPGGGWKRAFTLEAIGPGTWAQDLDIRALPAGEHCFHLSLRFKRGRDTREEFWSNLSTVRWLGSGAQRRSNPAYFARVLNGTREDPFWLHEDEDDSGEDTDRHEYRRTGSRLVRVSRVFDLPAEGWNIRRHKAVFCHTRGTDCLKDLRPEDFYEERPVPGESLGLGQLALVDEVSMVAVPDIMPPIIEEPPGVVNPDPVPCDRLEEPGTSERNLEFPLDPQHLPPPPETRPVFSCVQIKRLQDVVVGHCLVRKDRIAVLDTYPHGANVREAEKWRNRFDSKYAAMYYPWLRVPDPLRSPGSLRTVPPSGHVAGIFARVSLRVGPHSPPANEVLEGVKDLAARVGDSDHGHLNTIGLNVIRAVEGRDIRIAGARTVSSDAGWRYVNVRRLVTMIEETIEEQTQWTCFEPGNDALRHDVDRVLRSFLDDLWQKGFLEGATAEDAYSVQCDATTTTPYDESQGRMICEVGLNPPWPAEFVVVRIGITEGGVEVMETGGSHE